MYHCFCKNMVAANGTATTQEYKFANATESPSNLCDAWVQTQSSAAMATLAIPLVIGVINIGVEIIIGYGSEYISKPRNY